jgi:hypothetical protein
MNTAKFLICVGIVCLCKDMLPRRNQMRARLNFYRVAVRAMEAMQKAKAPLRTS